MDFTLVDPTRAPLARARLWVLRRIDWGWAGLREKAAKVASEEPKAAFWLKVEHEGNAVAILASVDGTVVTLKPASLNSVAAKRLTRSPEEADRVLKLLAPEKSGDASFAPVFGREREVVNNELVEPLWPDVETLKEGELVRGSPFKNFRVEANYYLSQPLVKNVKDTAQKLDKTMSYIVQKSYVLARDRIQKTTSAAELSEHPASRAQSVFLVMPSWMALEVERKAAALDCSKSKLLAAAVAWGLPRIENEK